MRKPRDSGSIQLKESGPAPGAAPFPLPRSEPEKILIVEDEPLISWSLSQALTHVGYKPLTVESGELAAKQMQCERFDLLITDVKLPQRSGIDVAADLRSKFPSTPVIFVSAENESELRQQFRESPEVYFLEKPFNLAEVVALVQKLFACRKTAPYLNADKRI